MRDHYRDCEEAGGGSNGSGCLPARVSHPLVMQAMDLVDEEVDEASGGITCLRLLVQHVCSSKVTNNAANSTSRIRQAMP